MRGLIIAVALVLLPTAILADATIGYTKSFFKGRDLDNFTTTISDDRQSLFLTFGGSGSKSVTDVEVNGDLDADIAGVFRIELPQEYTVTKKEKTNLWVVSLGYGYHFPITGGEWRGYEWQMDYSIGPMVQWSFVVHKTKYKLNLVIEPEQELEMTADIPTAIKESQIDLLIPLCYNASFFKGAFSACLAPNITTPRRPSVSISAGLIF